MGGSKEIGAKVLLHGVCSFHFSRLNAPFEVYEGDERVRGFFCHVIYNENTTSHPFKS